MKGKAFLFILSITLLLTGCRQETEVQSEIEEREEPVVSVIDQDTVEINYYIGQDENADGWTVKTATVSLP